MSSSRWQPVENIKNEIRNCFKCNVGDKEKICSTCQSVCTRFISGDMSESARGHPPLNQRQNIEVNLLGRARPKTILDIYSRLDNIKEKRLTLAR